MTQPLLHAAAWCPVYDPQCEEERATWLVEMLASADLGKEAVNRIVVANQRQQSTFWDRDHRCSVLKELARRGVPEARNQLYQMLSREDDTADVVGAEQIVELDGADGLLFVAEKLGEWLEMDPSFRVDDRILWAFDESEGTGAGIRVLSMVFEQTPAVARFLAALEHPPSIESATLMVPRGLTVDGKQQHVTRMKNISVEDVIAKVRADTSDRLYWLVSWGCHAESTDRDKIFETLLHESDPGRIAKYLRVFTRIGVPEYHPRFSDWLEMEKEDVRAIAVKVLSNMSDPRVRKHAIARLTRDENARHFILLLTKSFEPGDHRFLEAALRDIRDDHERHSMLYDLLTVFENNPVTHCTDSAVFIYENTPCTNCRMRALKLMMTMATSPSWILEELRFDSSAEIRSLVCI